MSLQRLGTRLTRLEHDVHRVQWGADVRVSLVRLMAEASTEMGLLPRSVQELCTACAQTLHVLSPRVPACLRDPQAVEAFMARVSAAVVTLREIRLHRHTFFCKGSCMISAVLNQKGGGGKTTLAVHIAAALARQGSRVRLVDADPQGSARDWAAARTRLPLLPVVGLDRPTLHRDLPQIAGQNTAYQPSSLEPPWDDASAIQVGGQGSTMVSKTVETHRQVQALEWALTGTSHCAGDGGSPPLIQNGIDCNALM